MAENRKKQRNEREKQDRTQSYLTCLVCNRTVKAEICTWEEDDSGIIYCQDCRAEEASCGCSD